MIGVPDERWGETVKALVVRAPGAAVDADELVAFARGKLAGYKLPRSVEFVAELPRSPAGKVLKRELRARYGTAARRRARARRRECARRKLTSSEPGRARPWGRHGHRPAGHEPCPRDAVGQPPAVLERQDPVLLAVHDERRRGDLDPAAHPRRGRVRPHAGGHRSEDRAGLASR